MISGNPTNTLTPKTPLPDAISPSRIRRVLLVSPPAMGDMAMTTPIPSVLKGRIPWCDVDILTVEPLHLLWQGHPSVAQIHTIGQEWLKRGLLKTLGPRFSLLRALGRRRYDLVIQPGTGSWGATLALLLRIPYAAGVHASAHGLPLKRLFWRSAFTHTPGKQDKRREGPRHAVETNLDLLRRIGVQPEISKKAMTITVQQGAREAMRALLKSQGARADQFIVIAPTASQSGKSMDKYLCRALIEQLTAVGEQVVLVSAPTNRELAFIQDVTAELNVSPHMMNLAGRLQIAELVALVSMAKCCVCMDSGTMHVAVSVGTPTVTLFGPGDERTTGPWTGPHKVISQPLTCRPCYRNGCGDSGVADCLSGIPVSRVLEAIRDLASA